MSDPNPRVDGGGHAWLLAHGIAVDTGVREDEAARQNAPFVTWIREGRPWTILKTVTSTDGFVGLARRSATREGGAIGVRTQLSGAEADRWMQRQRAWVDAIAVGADTVIIDDPLLTARGARRARPLTRVIVDWRGRIPLTARVWSTLSAGPVIMVVLESTVKADPERFEVLGSHGVTVDAYAARDLDAVTERLAGMDVQSLVLEGGPSLQRAWLDAGLVDRVQWLITPAVLGDGVPMVAEVRTRGEALSRRSLGEGGERVAIGDDALVEFDYVHRTD